MNEDPERLAAFEARALAELAVRNPAIERVVVTCNDEGAEVSIHPAAGASRSRKLTVTSDRQQLVDDLLTAVWDLAPEPPVVPKVSPPQRAAVPPAAPKPPRDRFFLLGRFGGEAWSGPIHGLWGADVGGAWARGDWSATFTVGLRQPLEVPAGFRLTEVGLALGAHVRLLGPLSLGATGQLWRASVEAGAATPAQQVAWSATLGPVLRANLELGRLVVSVGPELLVRLPAVEIRLDGREVAQLPPLAGGAALELRIRR